MVLLLVTLLRVFLLFIFPVLNIEMHLSQSCQINHFGNDNKCIGTLTLNIKVSKQTLIYFVNWSIEFKVYFSILFIEKFFQNLKTQTFCISFLKFSVVSFNCFCMFMLLILFLKFVLLWKSCICVLPRSSFCLVFFF